MKVPQFLPWIGEEEYKAIEECFTRNWITEGPKAKEFQAELLKRIGARYGVFAPNGTLALYLALKSLGVGPGDEVIVPDFTFIASANAVEMCGATPVFADICPENLQIDADGIKSRITDKTKAVMPVHILGNIGDMERVCRVAKEHKLFVVEDAAQSFGVHFNGRHAGTFGDTGAFSFFADKSITTAEGGFVVTNDEKVHERLMFLRNQGRKDRGTFIHPQIGYNFRMTDIQCAIGLVQLKKFDDIKKRKLQIKQAYVDALGKVKQVRFLKPLAGSEDIPFRVGVLCERAHELMEAMKSRGIEPRSFFYPLHKQPCYAYLTSGSSTAVRAHDGDFPNANYAYEHGICLPTFPEITRDQIGHVCSAIKEFYG